MSDGTSKTMALEGNLVYRAEAQLKLPPGFSEYELSFLNPVEVRADGKTVGWASVVTNHDPDEAHADVYLNIALVYPSPERLTLETRSEPLFAALGGVFQTFDEPFEFSGTLTGQAPRAYSGHLLYIDISRTRPYGNELGVVTPKYAF